MDRVIITRPFIEGVAYDVPDFLLRPRQASSMSDAIAPRGVIMQRKGWSYDGSVADVASNLQSFWRAPFILNDNTRSVTTAANGNIYVHNPAGAGTLLFNGSDATILARCLYRDELFFCFQDGITGAIRYSGAADNSSDSVSVATVVNQAVMAKTSGGTFGATTTPGQYIDVWAEASADQSPIVYPRILEVATTTSLTLEHTRSSTTNAHNTFNPQAIGYPVPCVNFYDAGTLTLSAGGNTATGVGTKWQTAGVTFRDGILIYPDTGDLLMYDNGGNPSSETVTPVITSRSDANVPYAMLRRMPFKDMAAHRDCLWGAGVAQYPSRLYVGPPGWDPTYPPGYPPPVDPTVFWTSPSSRDFLMDTIDVPSPYDGDYIVAILTTDQGLLVLKRSGAYMVDGVYPVFTTRMLSDMAGCIDIRSAQNLPSGPVWIGEHGAYIWRNGRIINMMDGRLSDYWAENFGTKITAATAYCTTGEVDNHIRVSARNDSGTTIVLVFDATTGVWLGTHSNQVCRNYFSSQVPGEDEELYGVSDSFQGRVLALSAVTSPTELVERDGDGTKPALAASTGTNMTPEVIDEERKLIDMAVTANVYDGGAAGSTILRISHTGGGSLRASADNTTTLKDINSDTVDRNDRHYIRNVNKNGRYHQISISVPTFDTAAHASGAKVEVSEFALTFAPTAERS